GLRPAVVHVPPERHDRRAGGLVPDPAPRHLHAHRRLGSHLRPRRVGGPVNARLASGARGGLMSRLHAYLSKLVEQVNERHGELPTELAVTPRAVAALTVMYSEPIPAAVDSVPIRCMDVL